MISVSKEEYEKLLKERKLYELTNMMFFNNDPDKIKYLHDKLQHICCTNQENFINILNYIASGDKELFEIGRDIFNYNINNSDSTFLQNMCECGQQDYIEEFLKLPFITQEFINKQTQDGLTCLHIISMKNLNFIMTLLNSPHMNIELFNKLDNNGNTFLNRFFYNGCNGNTTAHTVLKSILDSPFMNSIFFHNKNLKNSSIVISSLLNYPRYLLILLKSKYMNENIFDDLYVDEINVDLFYERCRTKPIKNMEIIFNSKCMTRKFFNKIGDKRAPLDNFVEGVCYYDRNKSNRVVYSIPNHNIEKIKIILGHRYMTQEQLNISKLKKVSVRDLIMSSEELINFPPFLIKLDNTILNKKYYSLSKMNLLTENELIKKRDRYIKAMKIIQKFMYKYYYRPNGIFYQKQLEKIDRLIY